MSLQSGCYHACFPGAIAYVEEDLPVAAHANAEVAPHGSRHEEWVAATAAEASAAQVEGMEGMSCWMVCHTAQVTNRWHRTFGRDDSDTAAVFAYTES